MSYSLRSLLRSQTSPSSSPRGKNREPPVRPTVITTATSSTSPDRKRKTVKSDLIKESQDPHVHVIAKKSKPVLIPKEENVQQKSPPGDNDDTHPDCDKCDQIFMQTLSDKFEKTLGDLQRKFLADIEAYNKRKRRDGRNCSLHPPPPPPPTTTPLEGPIIKVKTEPLDPDESLATEDINAFLRKLPLSPTCEDILDSFGFQWHNMTPRLASTTLETRKVGAKSKLPPLWDESLQPKARNLKQVPIALPDGKLKTKAFQETRKISELKFCSFCKYAASSQGDLNLHQRMEHNVRIGKPPGHGLPRDTIHFSYHRPSLGSMTTSSSSTSTPNSNGTSSSSATIITTRSNES